MRKVDQRGFSGLHQKITSFPMQITFYCNRYFQNVSPIIRVDVLRTYISHALADPGGVLVIDETGFLKKGGKSAGVQRQYSGTAGRIENCQIGVFLSYASPRGHTLLDRELYLPKSWTDNQERCREAHVPTSVAFATKPELAWRMLERTLDAGLPVAWVAGDTVYGSSQPLRANLEARKQAYALAVACKEHVEVQGTRKRVDQIARGLAREDWQELSAGTGSKGLCLFAWARIELAAPQINGWQHWLLVRRNLDEGSKPAEMAYILVFAPIGTSLEEMVEAFGARWTVEQCFEEAKGEVGLDEYARPFLARLVPARHSFHACSSLFNGFANP
jgi:SRSO17 transposase